MKLVEGGYYETKSGSIHKVRRTFEGSQPFMCDCCDYHWNGNGTWSTNGYENRLDLVRRVNAPVEYVAVKKWRWQKDSSLDAQCYYVTKKALARPPDDNGNWTKIEGTEVEE